MAQRKNKISAGKPVKALLFTILFLLMITGISAKYKQAETKVDNTVSTDFYFTSSMLSETGTTYTLMPKTTELEIPVCNYADDFRYSTKEIQYSYSVTKDESSVNQGNGSIAAGEKKTGSIKLTGLEAGTYKVTVISKSPFKTTLTGTFIIPEESTDLQYSVTDQTGSPYVLLTVWTENYEGQVKLTWPEGLIPDNTNIQMKDVNTYESGSKSYKAGETTILYSRYSSDVYRFFKQDTSTVYTDGQFSVQKQTSR